ncbi:MAG: response regulator transcription factor [Planctomycetota bacterium]
MTDAPGTHDRILLIEDEEHLAFTLSFNLEQEGYKVDVATDLATARRLVNTTYGLIVLDLMLPDGSGVDFTRELRQQGSRMGILMLTALGRPEDVVTGLDAGADDYVVKPFTLDVLLGRVRALLRRRKWDTEAVLPEDYSFGANRVNLITGDVKPDKDGDDDAADQRMTELELRLLRYFVMHANQPVSRQDLLEAVWDLPPTSSTRTVDNFIVRLRRRFEVDPANPRHVITVHGVGYRFIPHPGSPPKSRDE